MTLVLKKVIFEIGIIYLYQLRPNVNYIYIIKVAFQANVICLKVFIMRDLILKYVSNHSLYY